MQLLDSLGRFTLLSFCVASPTLLSIRTITICALLVILGAQTARPLCASLTAQKLNGHSNTYRATTTPPSLNRDGLMVQRLLLKVFAPLVEHYPAAARPQNLTPRNFFSYGWT